MTNNRFGKLESRALEYCERLQDTGGDSLTVEWRRNANGENVARIETWQGVAARASGCGYDKLSTVLAELLYWLGDTPEARRAIRLTGGAGESETIRALAAHGWHLECVARTKSTDRFTVRRIQP